jgi:hypothetical protein
MSEVSKPDVTAAWTFVLPQQAAMVEEMNTLMSCWMKRRQEALESGLQAFQKMAASRDPTEAAKACADWMGGSLNRILADVTDARERSVRMVELSQKAVQALSGQAAATMAAVGEQARETVQTAATAAETQLRNAA